MAFFCRDCCGIFTAKQGFQPSQQPDGNGSMRVYYGGAKNGIFLWSFPYVCPEPVLAK
jgi:hypothetical protein